ncbi:MAG: MT-A70 family methyltransferase [Cyanobacteria bacterium J06638_20]
MIQGKDNLQETESQDTHVLASSIEDERLETLKVQIAEGEELFQQCEEAIQQAIGQINQGFYVLGKALGLIQENRFYRKEFQIFETYCEAKWGIKRARAYQLIAAANVYDNLLNNSSDEGMSTAVDTLLPENEYQIRPLVKLPPSEQVTVWRRVLDSLNEGEKITQQAVLQALRENEDLKRKVLESLKGDPQVREAVSAATRAEREQRRADRRAQVQEAAELPDAKYRVFYADPPWKYRDSGVINDNDGYGRAERHYPTMSLEAICELGEKIRDRAMPDSALFLWVTSPILPDAFQVVESWGFQYKASIVWDKVRHNPGNYTSVRHEFLLICVRGSCTPDVKDQTDSVVTIERSKVHSQKPEYFRELIETMYPYGRRLELFARQEVEGWDRWGNQ